LISEVTMPSMGADMTEGMIAKWLMAEGDAVSRGDKLAEIETDKTVVEMEAYSEGLLRKIVVSEGILVEVGTVIAFIGDADDEVPEVAETAPAAEASKEETAPQPATAQPALTPTPVQQTAPTSAPTPVASAAAGGRVKASPIARKIAEEKGIDIAAVSGTGPGGRITKSDVEIYSFTGICSFRWSSTSRDGRLGYSAIFDAASDRTGYGEVKDQIAALLRDARSEHETSHDLSSATQRSDC